jgi:hypothetical protein
MRKENLACNIAWTKPINANVNKQKGKSILVTGYGDPLSCEKSRHSSFLNNQFTDGSEVVSAPYAPERFQALIIC